MNNYEDKILVTSPIDGVTVKTSAFQFLVGHLIDEGCYEELKSFIETISTHQKNNDICWLICDMVLKAADFGSDAREYWEEQQKQSEKGE